jgi:hypothetical protein
MLSFQSKYLQAASKYLSYEGLEGAPTSQIKPEVRNQSNGGHEDLNNHFFFSRYRTLGPDSV